MMRPMFMPSVGQTYNILEECEGSPTELSGSFPYETSIPFETQLKSKKKILTRMTENGINLGRWTKDEKNKYEEAFSLYGPDWEKIASVIKTRTIIQIRSHNQKLQKQKEEKKANQMYSYLKKQEQTALEKNSKEQDLLKKPAIIIEPNLEKNLQEILSPFSNNGKIILTKELIVCAVKKILENEKESVEEMKIDNQNSQDTHYSPRIIPLIEAEEQQNLTEN